MFIQPIKKNHPNKMAIRFILKKIHHFLYFFKRRITRFLFLIKEKKLIFNHCRVHSRIQPRIILTFELVNIMVNIFNFSASINKHENEDR